MAAEEKTPLLNEDEDEHEQTSLRQRQNTKPVYRNDSNRVPGNRTVYDIGKTTGKVRDNLSNSSSQNTVNQVNDHIVAVFIVAFDTKAGKFK